MELKSYFVIEQDNFDTMMKSNSSGEFDQFDSLSTHLNEVKISSQTLLFCLETGDDGKKCNCQCLPSCIKENVVWFSETEKCLSCQHNKDRYKNVNYATADETESSISIFPPTIIANEKSSKNNDYVTNEVISSTITKFVSSKESAQTKIDNNSYIDYKFSSNIKKLSGPTSFSEKNKKQRKQNQEILKRSKSVNILMNQLDPISDSIFDKNHVTFHSRHLSSSNISDILHTNKSSGLSLSKQGTDKKQKVNLVESSPDVSSHEFEYNLFDKYDDDSENGIDF